MTQFKNEAELTSALLKTLKSIPRVRAFRRNVGRRGRVQFGTTGEADIQGVVGPNGFMFAIELKMPGGQRTNDQAAWAVEMQNLGVAYLLTESLWEAVSFVQDLVERHGKLKSV